jgi:hypothetical protein
MRLDFSVLKSIDAIVKKTDYQIYNLKNKIMNLKRIFGHYLQPLVSDVNLCCSIIYEHFRR